MASRTLLFLQVVAHLAIIPLVLYGQWFHYVVVFVVYFFTGCFGMSMTYHRLLSHKSWAPPRWLYYFGSFAGTIGLTGSPLAWAAIHRQHHHYTDTEKDPHSPVIRGFIKSQFFSMLPRPNLKYVKDLIKDPYQRFLHKNYYKINILFAGVLCVLDPFAVIYAYLVPAAVLWNFGSFVNTIGHTFGYKNYSLKDSSRNNFLLGYLTWGEGWHNNHHAYPRASYFGKRWFEVDIAGLVISMIQKTKKRGVLGPDAY